MRIGVLTGGGDCPGLNAVIRAVVRKGVGVYGHEFVGYRDGWRGPLEGDSRPLGVPEVRGILPRGGTILGSSRTNPFAEDDGPARIAANLAAAGVDGLIAIGGEDTLGAASRLHAEAGIADHRRAEDDRQRPRRHRLHLRLRHRRQHRDGGDRPPPHHRRQPPPGADRRGDGAPRRLDRLPRRPCRRRQRDPHPRAALRRGEGLRAGRAPLREPLRADHRRRRGGRAGRGACPSRDDAATDAFGHVRLGGIAHWLEGEIERRTGKEARATVLGHVQRGGTPTAFDRVLATRFGLHAIDAAHAGQWGTMTALRGIEIELVSLERGDRRAEDGAAARSTRRPRSSLASRWTLLALYCLSAGRPRRARCRLRRRRRGERGAVRIYVSAPLHGDEAAAGPATLRGSAGGGGAGRRQGRRSEAGGRLPRRGRRRRGAGRWRRSAPTRGGRPRTRPRSPTSASRTRGRESSRGRSSPRPKSPSSSGLSGEEAVAEVAAAIREGDSSEPRAGGLQGRGSMGRTDRLRRV